MSFKDKFKAFWNSSAGNILALIVGIIALIISVVMISSRTEAAELVEEGESFPSLKDSIVEDYLSSDDDYFLYYFNNEFCFVLFEGGGVDNAFINYSYDLYVEGDNLTYINFYYDGEQWVKSSSSTVDSYWASFNDNLFLNTFSAYYSSFNILDHTESSSSNQIFFQLTPLPASLSPGFAVVGKVTAPQMSQLMMVEVIGLIPLLVGLVISVVALKKGWKYLKARLKTA